jgi:hypothetical protein
MSLEREVEHCADVANLAYAVMRAREFDRTSCACGVAIMASVLAGQDPEARTMLAQTMLKLARELDPDLVNAKWQ